MESRSFPFLLGTSGRGVGLWERLGKIGLGCGKFGVRGEVVPFVGGGVVVVEFLGAVGVTDVTPAFGAERVISLSMRGERGTSPVACGVFQRRGDAGALERVDGGQSAEFVQRGKEVDGADRSGRAGIGLRASCRAS